MNLAKRSEKLELLDGDAIPFEDIKRNMEELNTINKTLGGHRISTCGLQQLIGIQTQAITVCEIGCGGGDNLIAIKTWCSNKNIPLSSIGVDIKQACIDFAKTRLAFDNHAQWVMSDYVQLKFETKPHIIFSSLFCHHFTNQQLAGQLQWMHQNCSVGFFINDLQRHWLAYHSIKWLTRFFSSSYLVKNDAPLSVARGFTKKEWKSILDAANITHYRIQWMWAFRYLITVKRA